MARAGMMAGTTSGAGASNYPHLSTPNQCLAGFVQIVSLCAELFEGSPRQATLSGSNIDRSRNYNGPCGWSEMWVIARVGRLPESGPDLCSQPTVCRLENLPTVTALKRMMAGMVELFCNSFEDVPRRIVLDIDDTCDPAHGRQQLSAFDAYYDERCFLPIHVYEATTGKPVAVILRPGKTPDGAEVALVLRHVIRAIRRRWPRVDILVRGDSHYGRPEAMSWCERNRVAYAFGLAGNKVLLRRVAALAEAAAL